MGGTEKEEEDIFLENGRRGAKAQREEKRPQSRGERPHVWGHKLLRKGSSGEARGDPRGHGTARQGWDTGPAETPSAEIRRVETVRAQ